MSHRSLETYCGPQTCLLFKTCLILRVQERPEGCGLNEGEYDDSADTQRQKRFDQNSLERHVFYPAKE